MRGIMKQTAVEWLANRIIDLEERLRLKEINLNDFIEEKDLLVDQAKAMEKEQKGYSEKECYKILHNLMTDIKLQGLRINDDIDLKNWFEQNKK